MKHRTLIVASFMAAISLQAVSQEKFSLTYKPETGKSYRYRSENSYTATQEMMGSEMTVTGNSTSVVRYDIEKVSPEGVITLLASMEEMTVHTNAMGMDTTISQTDLAKNRVRQEISPNGEVISETKLDSTSAKKGGLSSRILGDNALTVLPANPVASGEKWTTSGTDSTDTEGSQTVTAYTARFELAGRESRNGHDCLKVNYTKTFELTGKMNQMGMDMFLEGDGESTGTYWFDDALGLLISDESTLRQDITMALTGQAQMTIPSSQVVTMKNTLVE